MIAERESLARGKAKSKAGAETASKRLDFETATGSRSEVLQRHLLEEVARTMWLPDGISEEERMDRIASAVAMLEGIQPQGEIEGMLATQMVGTHNAAMECLRRAMLPGQTFEGRDQNLKHAQKLLSLYGRQMEVLDKHRGKGQQKVTVEHVHVEAGGQAVVGHVETGGRKGRQESEHAAVEHAPEVPFETPAPAEAKKTKQRR